MADAYTKSSSIKSVTLVAPWLHDKGIATAVYGGDQSVQSLLKASDMADKKFKEKGQSTIAVAASATDKNSIMYKAPYYTEANRGLIKEYDNKFSVSSWRPWLTYDAMSSAKNLLEKSFCGFRCYGLTTRR